jgi:hypothetical protein
MMFAFYRHALESIAARALQYSDTFYINSLKTYNVPTDVFTFKSVRHSSFSLKVLFCAHDLALSRTRQILHLENDKE